jgi:hypothetical protein
MLGNVLIGCVIVLALALAMVEASRSHRAPPTDVVVEHMATNSTNEREHKKEQEQEQEQQTQEETRIETPPMAFPNRQVQMQGGTAAPLGQTYMLGIEPAEHISFVRDANGVSCANFRRI